MTRAQITTILMTAPIRQFENGPKIKGYFQQELVIAGVPKAQLKKFVRKDILSVVHVHLKQGTQNFYSLKGLTK